MAINAPDFNKFVPGLGEVLAEHETDIASMGSSALALGETSLTAYRGDRGKTAYDHSQAAGNPHGTVPGDITGFGAAALAAAPAETATTVGAVTHGASAKTTPVDADEIGIVDSAASNIWKRVTWANVKATLKSYFDTLYQPIATVLTNTTASFTTAQETKLSGIATGATANSSDATLLARANHTGTQTASTVSDFNAAALAAAPAATTTTEGALIAGATSKATPVDADYVGLMDSAASNVLKKLSWANIKATLKAYFDTLYQPVAAVLTNTTASFTTALETKLNGIATGATANSSDATLLARANHTGTQTASTVSDFNAAALAAAPAETVTTEGALINGATDKPTPVNGDYFGLVDSAASNVLKKLSWSNVKVTLLAYFDTKYDATGAAATAQAAAVQRANHTGTQTASTISDFAATVRSTVLTGLSLATNQAIAATDTLLAALGYLQKQITDLTTTVSGKQATLVSATNIKTINGSSVLGSGDLVVTGTAPDIALSQMAPTGNETITAAYSAYIAQSYEIPSGFTLEIGAGAFFEIG